MTPANSLVSDHIKAHVLGRLSQIEAEHDVVVLFAIESGSRAWGFASPDSDYDVRFIYAHNRDWYTGLYDGRDVIERPLDAELVDLAGWDVKKALRLLLKSNPALYEWMVSPVVYADDGAFRPTAQALFERVAERSALAHHYHSVAAGQWKREIDGNELVKLKKYFYIVRPLLSLQWVVQHGSLPPMNLQQLMAATDMPHDVRAAVLELLELKRTTPELGKRARLSVLDQWALECMATLKPTTEPPDAQPRVGLDDANRLFRSTVGLT